MSEYLLRKLYEIQRSLVPSLTLSTSTVKLEQENLLLKAKTDQIKSQKHADELYANALAAMKKYNGQASVDDEEP